MHLFELKFSIIVILNGSGENFNDNNLVLPIQNKVNIWNFLSLKSCKQQFRIISRYNKGEKPKLNESNCVNFI